MSSVNALSAVEAQRLGDRLKNWIGIIGSIGSIPGGIADFLDNFDTSKVAPFLEAFKAIGKAADTKGKVIAALEAARLGVLITTTTADDTIISAVAGIVGNGAVLDFIVGIIDKMTKAQTAGTMSALSDDSLAAGAPQPVQASGFDIGLLITIARTLWSIIQLFRKPATA